MNENLILLAPFAILAGLAASLIWLRGRSYATWYFTGTAAAILAIECYLWWGSGHMPPLGYIVNYHATVALSYMLLFACFGAYLYLLSTTSRPPK